MASRLSRQPALRRIVAKARSLRLGPLAIGRLLFNPWLQRFVLGALILAMLRMIPVGSSGVEYIREVECP